MVFDQFVSFPSGLEQMPANWYKTNCENEFQKVIWDGGTYVLDKRRMELFENVADLVKDDIGLFHGPVDHLLVTNLHVLLRLRHFVNGKKILI